MARRGWTKWLIFGGIAIAAAKFHKEIKEAVAKIPVIGDFVNDTKTK